ncbi:H/ACA ribonucleoprotein complex non-core subunit NAF1 [Lissotriton helveticus]
MEMNLVAESSENVGPDEQTQTESTEFLVLEQNIPSIFDSSTVQDDMISITNQYTNDCNGSDQLHKLQIEITKTNSKEALGDIVPEIMAWENQLKEGISTAGDENSKKVVEFQLSGLYSENGSQRNSDDVLSAVTHHAPGYDFVPIQIKTELLSSEDSSSDSDSNSDSSSSSSSSSSESTSFSSVSLSALLLDGDDDEDTPGKDGKGFPVTPKEVLHLNELPAVDDLNITLPDNVEMKPFGVVTSIVDQLVIFESLFNQPVLSEGSVIFKANRSSAGKIFDIFGPIPRPSYLLRFNSEEHIAAHGVKVEDIVYFVPNSQEFTKYLETEKLKQQKGSDASWTNDDEPPPDVLDFSDDEKEREAKKQRKAIHEGRKKTKTEQNESRNSEVNEKQNPQQCPSSQVLRNSPGFSQKKFTNKAHHESRQQISSYPSHQYSNPKLASSRDFPSNKWNQRPNMCPPNYRQGFTVKQEQNTLCNQEYYPVRETMWQSSPPPINTNMSWPQHNVPYIYNQPYSVPPPPPPPPPHLAPMSATESPYQQSYSHQFSTIPPPTHQLLHTHQFPSLPPPSTTPPTSISHSCNPSYSSMPLLFSSMPPPLSPHHSPHLQSLPFSSMLLLPPPPPPPSPPPSDFNSSSQC